METAQRKVYDGVDCFLICFDVGEEPSDSSLEMHDPASIKGADINSAIKWRDFLRERRLLRSATTLLVGLCKDGAAGDGSVGGAYCGPLKHYCRMVSLPNGSCGAYCASVLQTSWRARLLRTIAGISVGTWGVPILTTCAHPQCIQQPYRRYRRSFGRLSISPLRHCCRATSHRDQMVARLWAASSTRPMQLRCKMCSERRHFRACTLCRNLSRAMGQGWRTRRLALSVGVHSWLVVAVIRSGAGRTKAPVGGRLSGQLLPINCPAALPMHR